MKKSLVVVLVLIALIYLNGCSSVNVGGSGRIGDVTGSGQVSIPIPKGGN